MSDEKRLQLLVDEAMIIIGINNDFRYVEKRSVVEKMIKAGYELPVPPSIENPECESSDEECEQ